MNKLKSEINLAVGKSIKDLRAKHEWSQETVAQRLSISIPAFSKIETGVTDVNLSRLEQIAHIFEVDVASLFIEDKNNRPIPVPVYDRIQKKLADSEAEIVELQRKIIKLYEEIHGTTV
ncbi:MAG TPA: helix-turn-helix transcriptional regulator [Mucilaginibacter sp.]|nr:helix-turn-helix transcriptional regulator [Mucilaginibacter sp.]